MSDPNTDPQEDTGIVGAHVTPASREKGEPDQVRDAAQLSFGGVIALAIAALVIAVIGGAYAGIHRGGSGPFDNSNPFSGYEPTDSRPVTTDTIILTPFDKAMKDGKKYYATCAGCHQAGGVGVPNAFPPLANSEWVQGSTEPIAMIILHGLMGPIEVAGATYNGAMGTQAAMSNSQIAAVMTYIRNDPAFGNNVGDHVTEDMIARARDKWSTQAGPFVVADLEANDTMLEGDAPAAAE